MAKLPPITPVVAQKHRNELQALFNDLAQKDVYGSDSGFSADKEAIAKVFKNTSDYEKNDILVRLTLIDSMYSTQMNRRYYALDELAESLATLAQGKSGILKRMFLDFTQRPEECLSLFDYKVGDAQTNLFSECYGIGKGGESKGVAISLISKYAYFETEYGFPIYDSIACEMYPIVWHYCGLDKKSMPKLTYQGDKGKVLGDKTMVEYVKAINLIINKLNCKALNYDIFDRYLWFVGKICRGNLSLVLSRSEYEDALKICPPKTIVKTNKKGKQTESVEYFNVKDIDIEKLTFLNSPERKNIGNFFKLAKFYKTE